MNNITIGNVLSQLPTVRRMNDEHSQSPQVTRARILLDTGKQYLSMGRPWKPLITKRELAWILRDRNAVPFLKEAVELSRTFYSRAPTPPREEPAPIKVQLPTDPLDPKLPTYHDIMARFRYVRNVLLQRKEAVNLNGRLYDLDDLPKLVRLLAPWYAEQYDRISLHAALRHGPARTVAIVDEAEGK